MVGKGTAVMKKKVDGAGEGRGRNQDVVDPEWGWDGAGARFGCGWAAVRWGEVRCCKERCDRMGSG